MLVLVYILQICNLIRCVLLLSGISFRKGMELKNETNKMYLMYMIHISEEYVVPPFPSVPDTSPTVAMLYPYMYLTIISVAKVSSHLVWHTVASVCGLRLRPASVVVLCRAVGSFAHNELPRLLPWPSPSMLLTLWFLTLSRSWLLSSWLFDLGSYISFF